MSPSLLPCSWTRHAGSVTQQRRRGTCPGMDEFDFVIVGAGASGEAAAQEARRQGASIAIMDRDMFGGSCPCWACMPSKSLLHSAAVQHAGGRCPWPAAAAQRDYMINR